MRIIIEQAARWLPALLQISDAAFPTGSYAHSFGLEEMVRQGQVHDEPSLRAFLHEHAIPGLTHVDLPLVRESRAAAMAENRADLIAVDQLAAALRVPRELREASLQTGRRRLAILIRLRATPELELLHADQPRKRAGWSSCYCLGCFLREHSAPGISRGVLLSLRLVHSARLLPN